MKPTKQFFVVGQQYKNRKGAYTVFQIEANGMLIEYNDGRQQKIQNLGLQERIVKHLREEQDEISKPKRTTTKPHIIKHEQSTFYLEEVFPVIAEVITDRSQKLSDYVPHHDIVEGLTEHHSGQLLIKIAQERREKDGRPNHADKNIAGNMVAWFSQKYTEGNYEWQERFTRKRINNAWAYYPHTIKR